MEVGDVAALTTDQVQALTTAQIVALTAAQIPAFSSDQLAALTTEQTAQLLRLAAELLLQKCSDTSRLMWEDGKTLQALKWTDQAVLLSGNWQAVPAQGHNPEGWKLHMQAAQSGVLHGLTHQVGRFFDIQLAADIQAMGFHGSHTDRQFTCHGFVVQALRHHLQYLTLPRGQYCLRR